MKELDFDLDRISAGLIEKLSLIDIQNSTTLTTNYVKCLVRHIDVVVVLFTSVPPMMIRRGSGGKREHL